MTLMRTIYEACESNPLIEECVWGIHLEWPFISPKEGAKGSHDEQYIKAPNWELFSKFQEVAGGKIRLVTIAPESEGLCLFTKNSGKNEL